MTLTIQLGLLESSSLLGQPRTHAILTGSLFGQKVAP